jgi:hypothetical protein
MCGTSRLVHSSSVRPSKMPVSLSRVAAEPGEQVVAADVAESPRAGVDGGSHVHQRDAGVRLAAAAGGVEADEVALGGVDQVADDVPDLPRARRGGRLPDGRVRDEGEHAVGLGLDGTAEVVPAVRAHEVPGVHDRLPCPYGGQMFAMRTR